jgi:hypothetical protein
MWTVFKNYWIRLLLFTPLTVFFFYAAAKFWYDDWRTPENPVPMTLREAVDRSANETIWVELQDAGDLLWDCNSIVRWTVEQTDSEWMDMIVVNRDRSIVILVALPEPMQCQEIVSNPPVLSGELSRLSQADFHESDYQGRLSAYSQADTFLNLCTFCNPNESTSMIVLSLVCGAGSLLLFLQALFAVMAGRETRKTEPPAAQIVTVPPPNPPPFSEIR